MSSSESDDDLSEGGSRGIQSAEIAARVIEALCATPKAATLKQVSVAAEMAPSKVHRYMVSLVRIGIAQQGAGGRYSLGPMALRLGVAAIGQMDIIDAAGRAAAGQHVWSGRDHPLRRARGLQQIERAREHAGGAALRGRDYVSAEDPHAPAEADELERGGESYRASADDDDVSAHAFSLPSCRLAR